jgi:hypothetical protein
MSNNLPANPEPTRPLLSDETYDRLKFVAQILLPAAGALYFGLAAIWHLPAAEQVVGTVTVVDLFLGAVLGLSTKVYNNQPVQYDGIMHVMETDSSLVNQLELTTDPEDLIKKPSITFKVQPKHSSGYGDTVFPEDRL